MAYSGEHIARGIAAESREAVGSAICVCVTEQWIRRWDTDSRTVARSNRTRAARDLDFSAEPTRSAIELAAVAEDAVDSGCTVSGRKTLETLTLTIAPASCTSRSPRESGDCTRPRVACTLDTLGISWQLQS